MSGTLYYTAQDLQEMLGISRAKAYKIIKELNKNLSDQGYIVIAGRIPKKFLEEKCYGMAL
jgi:sugar-specific transcriptional regulator TrmB